MHTSRAWTDCERSAGIRLNVDHKNKSRSEFPKFHLRLVSTSLHLMKFVIGAIVSGTGLYSSFITVSATTPAVSVRSGTQIPVGHDEPLFLGVRES